MRLSIPLIRGLSIAVLMAASLLLAAACGAEPTPTPTPVPTPTPALRVEDFLAAVGANVGAMQTAKFSMIDETGTGALFLGTTFKSMEAELDAPDGLRMLVEVEATGFGFLEIEIIKVGEQAFIKLSQGAPWSTLPLISCPSTFQGWVWFLPVCLLRYRM